MPARPFRTATLCAAILILEALAPTRAHAALELFDRDPATGTVLAGFSVYMTDPTPNGTFSDSSTLLDTASLSGSITRGYPDGWSWVTPTPNTYARSTIDFTNSTISSVINYSYPSPVWYMNNNTRVDVYTQSLPSSYSLAGDRGSFNSRFIVSVYDNSASNLGQLGFIILAFMNGSYQLHVASLNDAAHSTPLYDWQYIDASAIPTASDLVSDVSWIVNGRTSDYYYQIGAEVSTSDTTGGHYTSTINFSPVPEPTSVLPVVLAGAAMLNRRSRKRRS